MTIWVDADACPRAIKDIIFRASDRLQLPVVLVANHFVPAPRSPRIRSVVVPHGPDVADNHIAEHATPEDLVITQDIPLAAQIVELGAVAINPRGELYTEENVRQRLSMRNFMDELRSSGIQTGGPPALNQADRHRFASSLDRILTQRVKKM